MHKSAVTDVYEKSIDKREESKREKWGRERKKERKRARGRKRER